MTGPGQDLRNALRQFRRSPRFAALAVATLALGIGANTAIFSVVKGVLLAPLPYHDPDRLVLLWTKSTRGTFLRGDSTGPDFRAWQDRARAFEGLAAYTLQQATLTGGGEPERLPAVLVTGDLLDVLGVQPRLGRAFLPEERRLGAHRVALVSDGFWRRRLGGSPDAVGRQIELDGRPYRIVGVMAPEFRFPHKGIDLWMPMPEDHPILAERGEHLLVGVGRLRNGATIESAQRDMDAVAAQLAGEFPDTDRFHGVFVESVAGSLVREVRRPLLVLLGAVALVLLIACANVANLLLGRTLERRREIAVRAALGAGRRHLLRQLLAEGLILSLAAGIVGVLLASWGLDALLAVGGDLLPRSDGVGLDPGVLGFTLLLSLTTGVGFGLVPALHALRQDLQPALRAGLVAATGRRSQARALLVLVEVSLSLVLLVGAGLTLHSFVRLLNVEPGFQTENLLSMKLNLPESRYPDNPQQLAFTREALDRIAALPGVAGAGLVSHRPLDGDFWRYGITLPGRPAPADEARKPAAAFRLATPGYFPLMGVPVLRGRVFDEADRAGSPRVLVVNETMARRFWPGQEAVGKQVEFSFCRPAPCEVIGVVGDVRHFGLAADEDPAMYGSWWQKPEPWMTDVFVMVRTAGDPTALAGAIKERIWSVDPALPVESTMTMDRLLAGTLDGDRFLMLLLGGFAVVALLLAAVGIYGVISYTVSRRTREMGVRTALGATRGDILRLVVGEGMALAVSGVVAGLAVSYAAGRWMQSLLFGVTPADPWTLGGVCGLSLLAALFACWLPARRAARVDPITALRWE